MKQDTQHTPGPWTLDPEGLVAITVEGADGCAIADVYTGNTANADLIAAAPELLAVLQQAMPLLIAHANQSSEGVATVQVARAAIAKATGA